MKEDPHPDVPEEMFDEEERNVEKEWQIFLNASEPMALTHLKSAIEGEDWCSDLRFLTLIPESVTLNTVSFYYFGTFREAYLAAQKMCDTLNDSDTLPRSRWEFERGGIMET